MATKILVVDDSETIRFQIKSSLIGKGFEVIEGVNGEKAFDCLAKNPDIKLIICDINMPVVDGLAFCERIHPMEAYKNIPILMLTTESDTQMKARARAAGVIAWITKPMNTDRLFEAVQKLTAPKIS